MREVLGDLLGWWREGRPVGMATVVATWRSAPRPAGAAMLVGPDGEAVGSVSGGCVEGAVYELAQEVVETGVPVLQRYGVSDDDAFAVGLTCGGILDVFVERVDPQRFAELAEVAADVDAGRPVALCTVIEHPDAARRGARLVVRPDGPSSGALGSSRADDAVTDDARGLLAAGRSETLTYGPDGERRGEGRAGSRADHDGRGVAPHHDLAAGRRHRRDPAGNQRPPALTRVSGRGAERRAPQEPASRPVRAHPRCGSRSRRPPARMECLWVATAESHHRVGQRRAGWARSAGRTYPYPDTAPGARPCQRRSPCCVSAGQGLLRVL